MPNLHSFDSASLPSNPPAETSDALRKIDCVPNLLIIKYLE